VNPEGGGRPSFQMPRSGPLRKGEHMGNMSSACMFGVFSGAAAISGAAARWKAGRLGGREG
jgi:hypothetical protein